MTRASFSLLGPETISRTVLDNGIVVLVRENPSAPVAMLEGLVPAGSVHEPPDKAGLAAYVASMLTRGSEAYDFHTFNETVESLGASITVGGDSHMTHFSSESLSEDFPKMVEILADVLRRPTFPQEHVEKVRHLLRVRLQEREQNTRAVAFRRFHELLFQGHPYARPVSGYPETVQAILRDDLVAFHRSHYTPQGTVLAVSGDVRAAEVVALVERHFGDWQGPSPAPDPPVPEPVTEIRRDRVAMSGKVQADIVVGCLAIPQNHPDYFPAQVANNILGQFGLMGRLGEVVRERQGLAYYSYSALDADKVGGAWLAAAGVNPANVDRAIESILAEFRRLAQEPVSQEELADSKANLTGSLPLRLETNEGVAALLVNVEFYGLGLDYVVRYPERIQAVTAEDVQRVAATYLRLDGYALAVAGPGEDPGDRDGAL